MENIAHDAIGDLSAFSIDSADDALALLAMWRRRDSLTVADIRDVVAHFRGLNADTAEQAPAAEAAGRPILSERDPAPDGAVRGVDNDGDAWPSVGTRWQMDGLAPRTTLRLVRAFGPIRWFDADGKHIATSRVGGAA